MWRRPKTVLTLSLCLPVFSCSRHYPPVDMFSLGLTLLEAGSDVKLPQGGEEMHARMRNNAIPAAFFQNISDELAAVLRAMARRDPAER